MNQSLPAPVDVEHCRGFRLQKLELYNWGTFDGRVFSVRPDGQTALLVGRNGSGKSTLVDALLTLLVRPGVRNFNVAAGAGKRERDERSYLKGAYDRSSDEDGQGIHVKYLRPKGDHSTVILACFRNADTGEAFTIAQLLYLAADQGVQKVYCFARDERSIQSDFANLGSTDGLLRTLEARGFRVTRKHAEFEAWFRQAAHVRSKAMEVLNQTVAVKDIQRLNDFIRNHMLEPQDWREKVDRLLAHFSQLSEAHRSLVRVRQQFEYLEPIARSGDAYRRQASELERLERLLAAVDTYLSQQTVNLFIPRLEMLRQQLTRCVSQKQALAQEIAAAREQCRTLRNEIDRAGGERLAQIPLLIRAEQVQAERKSRESARFHEALRRAGINEAIRDEFSFLAVRQQLPAILRETEHILAESTASRDALVLERGQVRHCLEECRRELEGLNRRRESLPEWCASLRQSLCGELDLPIRDLPFAAELIAVPQDHRDWGASIEKVLRGFALSLLVPERYYHLVSRHIDRTRLADAQGRGRRLVYLRVGEQARADGAAPGPQSMLRKLTFRGGHALVPWVKAELAQRFDYQCCDSVEEFQQSRGQAMTRNRHLRSGSRRHEKDDSDEAGDPRNFVLGWDNRDKKRRVAVELERWAGEETALSQRIDRLERETAEWHQRASAINDAGAAVSFAEIDFARHEQEIAALERERQAIESQSDVIALLKQRLSDAESLAAAFADEHDQVVHQKALLEKEIGDADRLVGNATADLRDREETGTLVSQRESFTELDAVFSGLSLTAENFLERKGDLRKMLDEQAAQARRQVGPLQGQLVKAMSDFLHVCPEERDLRAQVDYLDSFLGLRQRIIEEDLPRHERRFKERLNEKVIHEIGLFRSELDQERLSIEDKIETLNVSLRRLEYRPGTHIQLEPRAVRDPEIVAFQQRLRECIEGNFDDSPEANEARFVRIQELVQQLADESNHRWRDKVADVRRWFDFVASVIDRQSLKAVSVYQDSSGQSGGEKAKLAFTILVAAIAYQYDLDPEYPARDRFHFVVVDEMFSKVDDQHAEYALELFRQFGLQLLIVAPLDAKARVTQPYVGCYLYVDKRENRSEIFAMTAKEFEQSLDSPDDGRVAWSLLAETS